MEEKKHSVRDVAVSMCTELLWGESESLEALLPQEWGAADYDELCEYVTAHGLQSLVIPYLAKERFEDEETRETIVGWWYSTEDFRLQTKMLYKLSEQLAEFFCKRGIDVMFLKGCCLAQWYPKKLMRAFSDIDFYLFDKEQEGLTALMEAGYECQDAWDYHAHIDFDGVMLELHRDFLDCNRMDSNRVVDETLKQLAKREGKMSRCEWMKHDYPNAYCMSPTMNAIFLMRHMITHFVVRKIGLRHLYDWGLFLKESADKVNWDEVLSFYERIGIMEIASRIQAILYEKMMIPQVPDCPIPSVADEKMERVWHSIADCEVDDTPEKKSPKILLNMLRDKWRYELAFSKNSYWHDFLKSVRRGVVLSLRSRE